MNKTLVSTDTKFSGMTAECMESHFHHVQRVLPPAQSHSLHVIWTDVSSCNWFKPPSVLYTAWLQFNQQIPIYAALHCIGPCMQRKYKYHWQLEHMNTWHRTHTIYVRRYSCSVENNYKFLVFLPGGVLTWSLLFSCLKYESVSFGNGGNCSQWANCDSIATNNHHATKQQIFGLKRKNIHRIFICLKCKLKTESNGGYHHIRTSLWT